MKFSPSLPFLFAGAEVAYSLSAGYLGGVFVEEDDVLVLIAGRTVHLRHIR
jgi:hypothetical protein